MDEFSDNPIRLNLVLRTIQGINRLIIKETDRFKLLQGICRILVENRGYHNAWIVLLDDAGRSLISAESGLGEAFAPMSERLKNGALTRCAKLALIQSQIVLTKDPPSSCSDCPLASQYDGRSAVALPLKRGQRVYGLLSVCIPKKIVPDHEELDLLKDIAADIAFSLEKMDHEAALTESEIRFRNLVENSLIGISIIQNEQVLYQNREQERLFGPLPRSVKLIDVEKIHPDDVQKVEIAYQDMASGKIRVKDLNFRFFSQNHSKKIPRLMWVYCRAVQTSYKDKEAILFNVMDITRYKELERLLGIEDKMASLGRVAAGIAHEIRNPLSGINIYLNTLQKIYRKGDNFEMVGEILESLQSASGRIESVVKRVMDFSRPALPQLVLTDLNIGLKEAIKLSKVTLRKRGIKIDMDLAPDLPPCLIDQRQVEQVILNLINNAAEAMRHTKTEKCIEIASFAKDRFVTVTVSDSGPGVPLHMKEAIFDPFYTTGSDRSGIGLSIARRIITDHAGFLKVTDNPSGGARFHIEIPLNSGADSK